MQYWEVVFIEVSNIKFIFKIANIAGTGSLVIEKIVLINIFVIQIKCIADFELNTVFYYCWAYGVTIV